MAYAPSNYDSTKPDDTIFAETAQAEFRNIKGFFQGTIGRGTTSATLTNTITPIIALSVVVPANSLGTSKKLRLTWRGVSSNTTGVSQTIGVLINFGGTALATVGVTISNGTNVFLVAVLETTNAGATNAQTNSLVIHEFAVVSSAIPITLGNTVAGAPIGGVGISAIDTTVDCTMSFAVNMSVAAAAFSLTSNDAVLEWV